MGQKSAAIGIAVAILATSEDDAVSEGIGACLDSIGGGFGLGVGVDPDAGEIVAEARLKVRACCGIERFTR
jgi:hypothetical protein